MTRTDRHTSPVRPSIELRIEELILHGFAPGDHHPIGAAMERELGRLLSERGLPPQLVQAGERPSLDGGSFALRPNARPEAIGVHVARAVYGGFSK
jgi:hypothetical protein